ncbi:MAG: V-type ATP synthase subunit C [Tissierellia bacterium]|nr:V-type ATP synthase subunit C [Tissierellia bacterium]
MKREEFVQASATTRVYEKSLLRRDQIDRMTDAKTIDDVFRILSETDYSERISKLDDKYDIDTFLDGEINHFYSEIYGVTTYKNIVDIMAIYYIYHNLKVIVKESIVDEDLERLYCKLRRDVTDEIRLTISRGEKLSETDKYRETVNRALEDYEVSKDPQRIDLIIDRCYYNHLNILSREINVPMLNRYSKNTIDFYNVKLTLRAKSQNKKLDFVDEFLVAGGNINLDEFRLNYFDSIDSIISKLKNYDISPYLQKGLEGYKSNGKISEFDKAMQNYQMDIAKESKRITYGPEVLFSYLVAKEAEVESIRVIFTAKINDLPPDEIRVRLRDLYV